MRIPDECIRKAKRVPGYLKKGRRRGVNGRCPQVQQVVADEHPNRKIKWVKCADSNEKVSSGHLMWYHKGERPAQIVPVRTGPERQREMG